MERESIIVRIRPRIADARAHCCQRAGDAGHYRLAIDKKLAGKRASADLLEQVGVAVSHPSVTKGQVGLSLACFEARPPA